MAASNILTNQHLGQQHFSLFLRTVVLLYPNDDTDHTIWLKQSGISKKVCCKECLDVVETGPHKVNFSIIHFFLIRMLWMNEWRHVSILSWYFHGVTRGKFNFAVDKIKQHIDVAAPSFASKFDNSSVIIKFSPLLGSLLSIQSTATGQTFGCSQHFQNLSL